MFYYKNVVKTLDLSVKKYKHSKSDIVLFNFTENNSF